MQVHSPLASLRPFLEQVFASYHRKELLSSDPLEFVHRYSDPWDQEVVALVAAQLAYGNVRQIRASVARWLSLMEQASGSPRAFVRERLRDSRVRESMQGFVHRIHRGSDLLALLDLMSRSWRDHGSLGAHLVSRLSEEDIDFTKALDALLEDWKGWAQESGKVSRSLAHFLAAPRSGSCCKRWCMLLRWMGRRDELDPGLWQPGSILLRSIPSGSGLLSRQLVIPLDTHVGQICQMIGLTRRKSLNWKAAVEITSRLKQISSEDPVRYDFSLARIGIVDRCRKRFVPEVCSGCELSAVCRHGRRGERWRRTPLNRVKS